MANSIFLYASLCLLVLFNGCLAQRSWHQQQFYQCQLDKLNALEPNNRIEAEASVIQSWDPNDQQFQCVGVAVVRRTIEPNGLLLPHYTNAPQLIYIQRAHWLYNDDESKVVAVTLRDTNNQANLLDKNPRHFFLARKPEDEFQLQGPSPRGQGQGHQQQQGQRRDEHHRHQQQDKVTMSSMVSILRIWLKFSTWMRIPLETFKASKRIEGT
nr:glycinin g3 [Quercus suber]